TCQGGSIATTLATRAPGGKSPLRGALSLFLQAIGSGMSLHPCASPRPCGNASAIYSRTRASQQFINFSEEIFIASSWKITEDPSPVGRGNKHEKRQRMLPFCFYLLKST
ncbi:hypothetical protein PXI96_15085, partial [Enterobacter asburiae]|uniref:hypothetical protein n=1 Tax=Enterobacter asburiae TaxID=61645 RepID=UPI00237F866C